MRSLLSFQCCDSTTADIEGSDDEIIVGAKHGYAIMNRNTKKLEYIKKVWEDQDGPGKDQRSAIVHGINILMTLLISRNPGCV